MRTWQKAEPLLGMADAPPQQQQSRPRRRATASRPKPRASTRCLKCKDLLIAQDDGRHYAYCSTCSGVFVCAGCRTGVSYGRSRFDLSRLVACSHPIVDCCPQCQGLLIDV